MAAIVHESNARLSDDLFKNDWSSAVEVRELEKKRLKDLAEAKAREELEKSRSKNEGDTIVALEKVKQDLERTQRDLDAAQAKIKDLQWESNIECNYLPQFRDGDRVHIMEFKGRGCFMFARTYMSLLCSLCAETYLPYDTNVSP